MLGKLTPRRKECAPLAGKSTLSRLEHAPEEGPVSAPLRYHKISHDGDAIERTFVDIALASRSKPPPVMVIDLDATDMALHGHQEGRFFHGYYDCYCYLPLFVFWDRHLLSAKLRPANVDAAAGLILGDVGDVVEEQQVVAVELGERALQGEFAPRHLQSLHKIGGACEEHAPAVFHEREPDRRRQMALAAAGRAEQQQIGSSVELHVAGGQRHHLSLRHHRHAVEVERGERLAGGQARLGHVPLDAPSGPVGGLVLGECGEEAGGGPAFLVGLRGELRRSSTSSAQAEPVRPSVLVCLIKPPQTGSIRRGRP